MIFTESFRHFVQEWIKVERPGDDRRWPWRKEVDLFMVNLYAISSADHFTQDTLPNPFITLLINGINYKFPLIEKDSESLYRGYFDGESVLPRKYLFNPMVDGHSNIHTSRYSYNSDGYNIKDASDDDVRLMALLSSRRHVRHSIYSSERFTILQERLRELSEHTGARIRTAENLFDITLDAVSDGLRPSSDLLLIQSPILGVLAPIEKSKSYRIINGAFVICREPVRCALKCESSYKSYSTLDTVLMAAGMGNDMCVKAVTYLALECPSGQFTFQEFIPKIQRVEDASKNKYVTCIIHNFAIEPYILSHPTKGTRFNVRLAHELRTSLIQDIPEHRHLFSPRNEKLFKRSDMPPGFYKSPGGKLVTVGLDME